MIMLVSEGYLNISTEVLLMADLIEETWLSSCMTCMTGVLDKRKFHTVGQRDGIQFES